jgi:hypothetical protein
MRSRKAEVRIWGDRRFVIITTVFSAAFCLGCQERSPQAPANSSYDVFVTNEMSGDLSVIDGDANASRQFRLASGRAACRSRPTDAPCSSR